MEKWKQTVAVTPPRQDWLVKLWVLVITVFKCSSRSCSLGLILKLLANSLAFHSHSFPLPCHHPSHFQHSCQQPDKYVDFGLLGSMDLFSTVLPASPSHSQACLAHSTTVSKWYSLVQTLFAWSLRCYTFLVLLLAIRLFLFSS